MENKTAEQRLLDDIFSIGKEESEYESYLEDVEFYKWYKEIEKDEDNALVLWGHILLYLGVENPQGRIIVDILKDMEEVRDIISFDKLLDEFDKYYKFFSTF